MHWPDRELHAAWVQHCGPSQRLGGGAATKSCLGWLAQQVPAHASRGWRVTFLPTCLRRKAHSSAQEGVERNKLCLSMYSKLRTHLQHPEGCAS